MYNWRLLLLAFFAFFQPIASYTERNLFDGRQQCCDHRLSRDSTSIYGDNRFKSENRRVIDQRRDIREIRRDERRYETIPASPVTDTFRDSYRDREIRDASDLRTRLSRTEFHRERKSTLEERNGFVTSEQYDRHFRAADRIRSAENRRDNRFRVLQTDDTRIFRTRDVNEHLEQRNNERRTIDSRRETRLMRDDVDEVRTTRDIRDTREEFRRIRGNIIRTDQFRTVENQRIQQGESLDRSGPANRLVLRDQRNVRSLDRLFGRGNDDRRLYFENIRAAKYERENRNVRAHARNEAERRNMETPAREKSEMDREYGIRFSTTRRVVFGNQRSVRSLDRLLRESNDDKKHSFENVKLAKQERENRDLRTLERGEIRIEAARRNIGTPVRERSEVDRDIGSRFLAQRQVVLRYQHNVRSLDRPSMASIDDRRLSFENFRITERERESRDMRARHRDDVRDAAERSDIEIRARQRLEVVREMSSRVSQSRQVDDNNERLFFVESTRRNNELRTSTYSGDRININRERNNDGGYRSDRRNSLERNGYERRSLDSQFAARSRIDARKRTDERITNQMRNNQEDSRDNYLNAIRDKNLESRRTRQITERRLTRSESRLFENSQVQRSLDSREKEIDENRRTVDDRVHERIQRVHLRETTRNFEQRENVPRMHIRNREEREQRDVSRVSRERTIERRSIRETISSGHRDAREVHRRVTEIRFFRLRDSKRQFPATSESILSSRIVEREIPQNRDRVRDAERRDTRNADERRDYRNDVTKTTERQDVGSPTKSNVHFSMNHINAFRHKTIENENRAYENNWQNLIYTMQGIYLCSIFIPMLMSKNNDKKKAKSLGLWTPLQKLIKTD